MERYSSPASSLANDFINVFHILCMGMGGGAAVLTAQFWAPGPRIDPQGSNDHAAHLPGNRRGIHACHGLFPGADHVNLYGRPRRHRKGATYFRWSIPQYLLLGVSLTLTMVLRSLRKVTVPLVTSIISFLSISAVTISLSSVSWASRKCRSRARRWERFARALWRFWSSAAISRRREGHRLPHPRLLQTVRRYPEPVSQV